ncbi:MAG: hypothetical protein ACKOFA_03680, partial [Rhodoluna sp.]
MRKYVGIMMAMALCIPLSSCVATLDDPLSRALSETKNQIRTKGVTITGTDSLVGSVINVHQPNTGFFVNDAVLLGQEQNIRQFDRVSIGVPRSLEAAFAFADAKDEDLIWFASSEFKVIDKYVEDLGSGVLRMDVILSDQFGNLGKFKAQIDYVFENNLLVKVQFPKSMLVDSHEGDI